MIKIYWGCGENVRQGQPRVIDTGKTRNYDIPAMGGYGAQGGKSWGGGGVKEAYEKFKQMGLEMVEPGLQVLYKPSAEDMQKCYDFGREFAKRLKEYHGKY